MKQGWTVTIKFVETEGEDTPEPWYSPKDIIELVSVRFRQSTPIRDLELLKIEAKPENARYW